VGSILSSNESSGNNFIMLLGYTSAGKSTIVKTINHLLRYGQISDGHAFKPVTTRYLKIGEATHGLVPTITRLEFQSQIHYLFTIDYPGHDFINMIDALSEIYDLLMLLEQISDMNQGPIHAHRELFKNIISKGAKLEKLITGDSIEVDDLVKFLKNIDEIKKTDITSKIINYLKERMNISEGRDMKKVSININDLNKLICEISLEGFKTELKERCQSIITGIGRTDVRPEELASGENKEGC